jgi:hypothetical protein
MSADLPLCTRNRSRFTLLAIEASSSPVPIIPALVPGTQSMPPRSIPDLSQNERREVHRVDVHRGSGKKQAHCPSLNGSLASKPSVKPHQTIAVQQTSNREFSRTTCRRRSNATSQSRTGLKVISMLRKTLGSSTVLPLVLQHKLLYKKYLLYICICSMVLRFRYP